MRKIIIALGAGALLGLSAAGAQALPVTQSPADGLVHEIAQGCGPGFARGPRGVCRPMMGPRRGMTRRCVTRYTPRGRVTTCRS